MKNIHDNSRRSLREVLGSGEFSRQQERILREIFERGPGTNREIDARIAHGGRSWHPVLNSLEARGAVKEVDRRPCAVTHKTVKVYGLGEDRPLPRPKLVTRKQIYAFLGEIGEVLVDAGHELSPSAQEVWDWVLSKGRPQ